MAKQSTTTELTDLRDLVWTPAHFEWVNGGEIVGFVPTRYPGTEASEDDALRRAARTEWRDTGADTWAGLGQHRAGRWWRS